MPEHDHTRVRAIRVVVGDDSVVVRTGIVRVLEDLGFTVVAAASDGRELVQAVEDTRPDVALVDIRMPPSMTDEGLRAAAVLAQRCPGVGVMVFSQHVEAGYAMRLLADGTPGRGYMLKDHVADLDTFAGAVTRVASGDTYVDPAVVQRLVGPRRSTGPLAGLTDREREVLTLMAEGRSNGGICASLSLSPRTVEAHVRTIMIKLGLSQQTEDHRRVLAVLAYLRGSADTAAATPAS